jgi:hypothetical protein
MFPLRTLGFSRVREDTKTRKEGIRDVLSIDLYKTKTILEEEQEEKEGGGRGLCLML